MQKWVNSRNQPEIRSVTFLPDSDGNLFVARALVREYEQWTDKIIVPQSIFDRERR